RLPSRIGLEGSTSMESMLEQESGKPSLIAEPQSDIHPTLAGAEAIGIALVKAGFLTDKQLAYARRVQSKLSTSRTLFSVLQELQFVTELQLRDALSANTGIIRFGDLLVELGVLQKTQLEVALDLQKGEAAGKRLGEILVERRLIDTQKLCEVLAMQY